MSNSPTLSEGQVQRIAEILMQYAPEGWLLLTMVYRTNENMTNIETWAKTCKTSKHGFVLDDTDADAMEEIFEEKWIETGKSWSMSAFTLDSNGNYNISFQ